MTSSQDKIADDTQHLPQLEREASDWRRSARYEFVYKVKNNDEPVVGVPKYLTLHEFEDGRLGTCEKVTPPVTQTDWTKKVMGSVKRADVAKFRLITTIDDENATL